MPKTTSLLSDFLTESRILVENARNLPDMSAVLKDFGEEPVEVGVSETAGADFERKIGDERRLNRDSA